MNQKMLRLLVVGVILLLVFIIVCTSWENKEEEEISSAPSEQITEITIGDVHQFDHLDYNHLSREEMEYISDIYSGLARFTR